MIDCIGTKLTVRVNSWKELNQDVPQGSALGLGLGLLFNIYLNDLLLLFQSIDVCNVADDKTFCACDTELNSLIKKVRTR